MKTYTPIFERLRGKLVVSCQALPDEPLFGSEIMARVALAAKQGGASGIRANTPQDITAIKTMVPDLPLIGLYKVVVTGFEDVYITPRLQDAVEVANAGADIIAVDATLRRHPEGSASDHIKRVREMTGKLVMADIDNEESALAAIEAGADCVSTTLSGYTPDSRKLYGPDLDLVTRLSSLNLPVPVFAEGRIHTPKHARQAIEAGAFAVVVGGAITRPQQITERFMREVSQSLVMGLAGGDAHPCQ